MLKLNLLPLIQYGHGKQIILFLVTAVQIFENCYGVLPQSSSLSRHHLSVLSALAGHGSFDQTPSSFLGSLQLACLRVGHPTQDIILQGKTYITAL